MNDQLINRYEMKERIAQFGFGVILKVKDCSDSKIYALKTVQTRELCGSMSRYSKDIIESNIEVLEGEILFFQG